MARLESERKAGYYRLPDALAPMIAERIGTMPSAEREGYRYRILDPCCGEGIALADIAELIRKHATVPIETYGIELHPGRAASAAEKLDQVTCGDIFAAETTRFDAVYLNPPYVHGSMESRFLDKALTMIADNGLLILVIQKKTLRNVAGAISSNFHDICVREFPEPEREIFGQITLTARKNPGFVATDPETRR
ncbi:MAG: DUF6094 domain-containing protein, partial [Dehalococcoidia bacterium]|nr:DUF6094 domain-containing protein [Dehalococcoidia bacterium]